MVKSDRDLALGAHRYRLADGTVAMSVTSVCEFADEGKSMGFAYKARSLAREGVDFREEWDAKRDTGTRVHGHVERWLAGEPVDASDDDAPYLDALEEWWEEAKPVPTEVEAIVLRQDAGYGGRFDFCAELTHEGVRDRWLVDVKTGKPYPTRHALQVNAYAFSDGIAVYDEQGSLSGVRDFERPTRLGCLYVEPGVATLCEYPLDGAIFATFCDLLRARRGFVELDRRMQREERNGRTSEP